GSAHAPASHVERMADGRALRFLQRQELATRTLDFADRRLIEQPIHLEHRIARQDARALQHISELADIARPRIADQSLHRARPDPQHRLVELALQSEEEMLDELRYVLRSLAKWRHPDGEDVQAIEEVRPERTRRAAGREIAIRCGDDSHVYAHRLG